MINSRSTGIVEPNLSFMSSGDASIVILPIDHKPDKSFFTFAELIAEHGEIPLHTVRPFYQEKQKSPFDNLPWNDGCMRLKFTTRIASQSDLGRKSISNGELSAEILQGIKDYANKRRTFGVIGICSCAHSDDIKAAYESFISQCRTFSKACAFRLLAFNPKEDHIKQDNSSYNHLIMVPPTEGEALRQHIEVILQDFSACIIMGLEQLALKADQCDLPSRRQSLNRDDKKDAKTLINDLLLSSKEILKSAPEIASAQEMAKPSEKVKSTKKRKLASVQRDIGYYCLASGSPVDALLHFSTAIELSQSVIDIRTNADALEGYLCAILLLNMKVKSVKDSVSVEDLCELIISKLRLAENKELLTITQFKYAKHLVQSKKKKGALKILKLIEDVREYDARNFVDSVIVNLELAILFEEIACYRQQELVIRRSVKFVQNHVLQGMEMDGLGMPSSMKALDMNHEIQGIIYTMLFSHRTELCRKVLRKFQNLLFYEATNVQNDFISNLKAEQIHLELDCGKHPFRTLIEKKVDHGPFLFSPRSKKSLDEQPFHDNLIWAHREMNEVKFYLRSESIDLSHLNTLDIKLLHEGIDAIIIVECMKDSRHDSIKDIVVKVMPLEIGVMTLHGLSMVISGKKINAELSKPSKAVEIIVVERLPRLEGSFCSCHGNALQELHLFEYQEGMLTMKFVNIGETPIASIQVVRNVNDNKENSKVSVEFEGDVLDEVLLPGQAISLRVAVTANVSSEHKISELVFFTVLFSESGKSITSEEQKANVYRSFEMPFQVYISKGLFVHNVRQVPFTLSKQFLSITLENGAESILQICRLLSKDKVIDSQHEQWLDLHPSHTSNVVCLGEIEEASDLYLQWRSMDHRRRGTIKIKGANDGQLFNLSKLDNIKLTRFIGSIMLSNKDSSCKPLTENTIEMQVSIFNQSNKDDTIDFEIKCLRSDGSRATHHEVILAGQMHHTNAHVPSEGSFACKFVAYFLCPGTYTLIAAESQSKTSVILNVKRLDLSIEAQPINVPKKELL